MGSREQGFQAAEELESWRRQVPGVYPEVDWNIQLAYAKRSEWEQGSMS